jgi:hypothetical protein
MMRSSMYDCQAGLLEYTNNTRLPVGPHTLRKVM